MAYESKNLSIMAYANGFTLWNYQTADTLNSVESEGYFNDATSIVRTGDMILTVAENKSSISPAMLCVSDTSGGNVRVVNMNTSAA